MAIHRKWPRARMAWKLFLAPAALYLAIFCALTYPLITLWSTHIFADQGDGLQNYWNIWWVNKAVTQLHQPFWKTPYLHYPYGTSLLGHTLNPFNGLLAIPLLRFLTLTQTHNFIVVFSFVVGGVTAFLLAHHLTRSYPASLIAGFIFTFSNFHFAHAEGHLQLVSLEWIPLFALGWLMLLHKPHPATAAGAALALAAITLCDYYYLFYSVLLAVLALVWRAFSARNLTFFATRQCLVSLVVFSIVALLTAGPLVISMLLLNARDPLIGAHTADQLSLDLLAPFIPGGHWLFANLTEAYWSKLPGFIHESSVDVGLSVSGLLVYVWIRRRAVPSFSQVGLWCTVLLFFLVMSLGPALHLWGTPITPPVLPYAWMEAAIPTLALSGVPLRMMVMVMLAASVLAAAGFKLLLAGPPARRPLVALLLVVLLLEYLPKPIPASAPEVPGYVGVLKGLKDDKGVLDTVATPALALYYQTIHERPMALGYIARVPSSVAGVDNQVMQVAQGRNYGKLRDEFGIKYLVLDASDPPPGPTPARVLYQDPKVKLYDLGP